MTATSRLGGAVAQGVLPATAVALVGLVFLMLLDWVGVHAWDDGAITLAYARTLAETGRFAVTPVSEVVEGSSSLLFVAAMAAVHALRPLSFEGLVFASQLTALLAWLLTLVLVERKLRAHVHAPLVRAGLVAALALLPMPMAEVFNGMEMTTFALLLWGLVEAFERRHVALYAWVPLVLLVRFESVFYLGVAFAGVVLWRPRDRAWAWRAGLWTIACWLMVAAWRWSVFGDWMPNTIHAKMHPPYMPSGHGLDLLMAKADGLFEFMKVNVAWLLALAGLGGGVVAGRRGLAALDLRAWLVLSFGLFAALSGANWGYQGRMCLAALPLLFVWAVELWSWRGSAPAAARGVGRVPVPLAMAALLLVTLVVNANVLIHDAKAVMRGGFYQHKLPASLHDRVEAHLASGQIEFAHWMGVTPANFRATGLVVERVRRSLGLAQIGLFTPDVGGTALCCPQIRVLDSGLLTSRELAHAGYAGLSGYFTREQPDLVITHTFWSALSGIHDLPAFVQGYVPVVIDDMQFWLRRDHLGTLRASPDWQARQLPSPSVLSALKAAKYGGKPEDLEQVQRHLQRHPGESLWAFVSR